jgi:hypothetical protein
MKMKSWRKTTTRTPKTRWKARRRMGRARERRRNNKQTAQIFTSFILTDFAALLLSPQLI